MNSLIRLQVKSERPKPYICDSLASQAHPKLISDYSPCWQIRQVLQNWIVYQARTT